MGRRVSRTPVLVGPPNETSLLPTIYASWSEHQPRLSLCQIWWPDQRRWSLQPRVLGRTSLPENGQGQEWQNCSKEKEEWTKEIPPVRIIDFFLIFLMHKLRENRHEHKKTGKPVFIPLEDSGLDSNSSDFNQILYM